MKKSKSNALMVVNGGEAKPIKGDALIRAMAAIAVKDYDEQKSKAAKRMGEIRSEWNVMVKERLPRWLENHAKVNVQSARISNDEHLPEPDLRNDTISVYQSISVAALEDDAKSLCAEYHQLKASIEKPYGYRDDPIAWEFRRIKAEIQSAELEAIVGDNVMADNLRSLLKQLSSNPKSTKAIED